MLNLISLNKMSVESGYSIGALHKKIHEGVLIEGEHYFRAPDRRIHFDVKEFEKWIKCNYRKA